MLTCNVMEVKNRYTFEVMYFLFNKQPPSLEKKYPPL